MVDFKTCSKSRATTTTGSPASAGTPATVGKTATAFPDQFL